VLFRSYGLYFICVFGMQNIICIGDSALYILYLWFNSGKYILFLLNKLRNVSSLYGSLDRSLFNYLCMMLSINDII